MSNQTYSTQPLGDQAKMSPSPGPGTPQLLLRELSTNTARLKSAVEKFPENARHWRPEPTAWNLVQVVGHLAAAEPLFRFRLNQILAEDRPYLPWFGPATARPETTEPLHTLLSQFAERRAALASFLQSLPAEAWERPAVHQTMGPTTLTQQVETITRHDREHLTEIGQLERAWQARADA